MKAIRLILWLSLIGVAIMTTIVSCAMVDRNKDLSQVSDITNWDKAEFYPSQIVDMYHATNSKGEACYWLIYDDIDAGFDNEIISMDEVTFHIIKDIWTSDKESQKHLITVYNPMICYNHGTNILMVNKD